MSSDTTPQTPGVVPELLTLAQAAALCGLGPRTLARYSASGLAPCPLKLGNGAKQSASRYRRADLLGWIERGCQPVADGPALAAEPRESAR